MMGQRFSPLRFGKPHAIGAYLKLQSLPIALAVLPGVKPGEMMII